MKIKTIVAITLVIFFLFVSGVIAIGLLVKGKPGSLNSQQADIFKGQSSIALNIQEIAKHSSASDCWMVINNSVYDVTQVINIHPGGPGTIIAHCGTESTNAWNTKDNFPARMHSFAAQTLLQNYLLGNLNQTITAADFQNTQQKSLSVPQGFQGRED